MNGFTRILISVMVASITSIPAIMADNNSRHKANHGNKERPAATAPARPVQNKKDGNKGNHNKHNTHRPGQTAPLRPGNSGNSGNHNGHYNHPTPQRPNHHTGPVTPARPPHIAPPPRPHRPHFYSHYPTRPVRPGHWHPRPGIPVISSILGIAFGTPWNVSLNMLYGSNYIIDGYANDMVYLRNVNMLNAMWPDATLYFTPSGGLDQSAFYYSTPYYDLSRYNSAYAQLTATYGPPVYRQGLSATWFGGAGNFTTLTFSQDNSFAGNTRYYTTLTVGR